MRAGSLPFNPTINLTCKYAAKFNQVIKAQVSLGSQLQYEPQASFAQTAPAMIPIVKKGNPRLIDRKLQLSILYKKFVRIFKTAFCSSL